MPAEQWREISFAPGYMISDQGRVMSHRRKTPAIRSQFQNQRGYHMVTLRVGDITVARTVHRMVAEAFIGPLPEGRETRHIDGDKSNNVVSNLAYGTKSENMLDQVRHGVHNMARKTECPSGHAYDEANTGRSNGRRYCLACRKDRRIAAKQVAA